MKNQVTQGVATIGGTVEVNTQIDLGLGAIAKASEQVKDACTTVFQLGTLANVALTSGNIEAAEQ